MKPQHIKWRTYVIRGTGKRLSRAGEALGWHWLTYNPLLFRSFLDNGLRNAPKLADTLQRIFPESNSIVDFGAGAGAFAAECSRRGYRVDAFEHSRAGRRMGKRLGVEMRDFDLTRRQPAKLNGMYDVASSFEVAEHLPPELGRVLVDVLTHAAPNVMFSAAHPGQGGTGHINEQPQSYWCDLFSQDGFELDEEATALATELLRRQDASPWFLQNMMIFRRRAL